MIIFKRKILILTGAAAVFFSLTAPLAEAKFHFRGGPVFDAKRFADSVKETAEMVKVITDSLETEGYIDIINSGFKDNSITARFMELTNESAIGSTGKSLLNYRLKPQMATSHRVLDVLEAISEAGKAHSTGVLEESSLTNMEILAAAKKAIRNSEELQKLSLQLNSPPNSGPGELGQLQKQNIHRSIQAMGTLDKARLSLAETLQELQKEEAQLSLERLEKERRKQQVFKSYDPYRPNALDKANLKKVTEPSKDLGFIPFGAHPSLPGDS